MKRSVFFNDNSLFRCFGTDPTLFRTTAALRWWGTEMELFSVDSFDRH